MSLESYNANWPCHSVTKLETIGFPMVREQVSVTFQLRIVKHGRVALGAVSVLPGVGGDCRKTDAGHVRFSKSQIVMRALALVKMGGCHEAIR